MLEVRIAIAPLGGVVESVELTWLLVLQVFPWEVYLFIYSFIFK